MGGIPAINLVAAAHLFFIAMFMGIFASESVIELHSYFRKNDSQALRMTARHHYWIDTIAEIPTVLAIVATGVWMAFLVENLTPLHWLLMGLFAAMLPGVVFCMFTVRKRYRMLSTKAGDEALRTRSRQMILGTALFINPFLIGLFILGFWLAYHRILNSIYG